MATTGPFFVVGCPRSGTTLLGVLLDRHPRLAVPPETGFYDEVAPALARGEPAGDVLARWSRLPELGLGREAVLARAGPAPAAGALLAAILDGYADARGKPRGGEKTPQHLPHVPRILADFPDAQVVCLLRDGREAALSLHAMPWFRGTLADAAELWRSSLRLSEWFAREHAARFLVVRCEELVARTEAVLADVMAWLGEAVDARQLRTDVPSGVVLARSLAWKGAALGPVDPARTNGRSAGATAADLAFLEATLGEDLARAGYRR